MRLFVEFQKNLLMYFVWGLRKKLATSVTFSSNYDLIGVRDCSLVVDLYVRVFIKALKNTMCSIGTVLERYIFSFV